MVTLKTRKSGCNKGTATVEAAIIFPVLLMLTFGAMQYGWLFVKTQQITSAARSGARAAIRWHVTEGEVRAAVNDALVNANGLTVKYGPSFPNIEPGRGKGVTVTLISTSRVRLLDILFLPTPETVSASVTMAKEGL